MAVFGARPRSSDHAERALHAALAMQERPRRRSSTESSRCGSGVNTGDVVVGAAREEGLFVTGDVVNVADRLQKGAEPGEVLAGERTVRCRRGRVSSSRHRRAVEARGKPDGVVGVSGRHAARSALRRPRGVEDSAACSSAARQRARASPRDVPTCGGASRRAAPRDARRASLASGSRRSCSELQDVRRCEEELPPSIEPADVLRTATGITYRPLGEILREHYELREGAALEDVEARLAGREILGARRSGSTLLPSYPSARCARAICTPRPSRSSRSSRPRAPTVVVIEDIHWAELRSARSARAARHRTFEAPVMLVDDRVVRRSSIRRDLGARDSATRQSSGSIRLSAAAVSQLPRRKVPSTAGRPARPLLVERADGNPFFLEELVGRARRQRRCSSSPETSGRWSARTPTSRCRTPCTRCSRRGSTDLPALEKSALQAGAVVGRVFWGTPVVHLSDGAEPDFGVLEERDLVTERRSICRRRPRVRHQARAHAGVAYGIDSKGSRGRLHARRSPDGSSEPPAGGRARAAPRAPLLARRSIRMRPTSSGQAIRKGSTAVRERAVHWLAARRTPCVRSGRMDGARRSSCSTRAVELHRRRLRSGRASGAQWAKRMRCATTARACGVAAYARLEGPLDDAERADTYAFLGVPGVDPLAQCGRSGSNTELHRGLGCEGARACGRTARSQQLRAMLARPTSSLAGDLRGNAATRRAALAETLRQRRAPLVRTRRSSAGRVRPSPLSRGGRRRATSGSRSSVANRRSRSSRCEAYESASPRLQRALELRPRRGELGRRCMRSFAAARPRTIAFTRCRSSWSLQMHTRRLDGTWRRRPNRACESAIEANLATPVCQQPA